MLKFKPSYEVRNIEIEALTLKPLMYLDSILTCHLTICSHTTDLLFNLSYTDKDGLTNTIPRESRDYTSFCHFIIIIVTFIVVVFLNSKAV